MRKARASFKVVGLADIEKIAPASPEDLAETLGAAAARKKTISMGGAFSKRLMGGPTESSDVTITSVGLGHILKYEPRDLTISVEAGVLYSELSRVLAENRQMIPLDPPFSGTATMGGIVASNSSGPRRRLYGAARDLVIGMKFATLEGKLVETGGMVVKNVAGLDIGKLMIGSFGTLAAIAVVNFKVLPKPALERTYLLAFESLADALAERNRILKSVLQPSAIDLLNPLSAAQLGYKSYVLAVQFGGNAAVVARCGHELGDAEALEETEQGRFWRAVQNFTQRFLEKFADAVVVRVSCTLSQLGEVLESIDAPAIARAGSGVCYAYFGRSDSASRWMAAAVKRGWKAVMEFSPESQKSKLDLWPVAGPDFEMMKKVKQMFDPNNLLNRGRLYRRI